MAGPMDMMGGGPPSGMGEGPSPDMAGGPPPSMGGGEAPTVDDVIMALKQLPMEVRQQIADGITSEGPPDEAGPPPSMGGSPGGGSPMEEIAKARASGPPV